MRIKTVLRKLVGVISLFVAGVAWEEGLVFKVTPRWRRSRCGCCGQKAPRYDRGWLAWAMRSRLKPMVKAAKTIKKHRFGILAYVATRLTNGLVEGINNHLRVIARRAYGFHSAGALISMLFLCCGGIVLNPSLP